MRFLAILVTCLFIGAATWIQGSSQICAGMVEDKFPPEVQKIIDGILVAKIPEDRIGSAEKQQGYRVLFEKVGADGVKKLRSHSDASIALQAAWQEVELTLPVEKQLQSVSPDRKELERFTNFMEQRCKVKAPAWWKEALLDATANRRYRVILGRGKGYPYHDSGLDDVRTPRDTSLKRLHSTIMLQFGKDLTAIPEEVLKKSVRGKMYGFLSATLSPSHCYLAIHDDFCCPYKLTSVDRVASNVVWISDVWGSWWFSIAGEGIAKVNVIEQDKRIIVFGVANGGFHVEGFNAADGKNLFRVSNCYTLRWDD